MINLLFDLNNIAHRSLFVISGYGSKTYTFDSQNEIDQLMRKMAMDIAFLIRTINPSRIFFAQDSKSWRKDIFIEENDGYKAQRKKSAIINWKNVYNSLDEFIKLMESNGMITTKLDNAEADDIISLWSNEIINNEHQHVIIISGDEDMRQLVKTHFFNNEPSFVSVYNPFMQGKNSSKKLYVSPEFDTWIHTSDEVDFMNMKATLNIDKEDFNKIITSEKTKMEVINGPEIAIRKIFCGDDGDNVPAIYTWLSNEKEVRITNSKYEKIIEMLSSSGTSITYDDLLNISSKVYDAISKIIKQKPNFDINERLLRQIKLVVLDPKYFPEEIVNQFNIIKDEQLKRPRINYSNINMKYLLDGTRYVSEVKSSNEASIFKEIDRIKQFPLF
ncbi:hypothetical protein M0Q50_06425 [bacterium]|jgi:5'-3' exonuclease|nr:hypothetical protein [bacterium]